MRVHDELLHDIEPCQVVPSVEVPWWSANSFSYIKQQYNVLGKVYMRAKLTLLQAAVTC